MTYIRDHYKFTGDQPITRPYLEPIEFLLPAKSELEQGHDLSRHIEVVRHIFFNGLEDVKFRTKLGIDQELAERHIKACYFKRENVPHHDKEKGMALLLKKFMLSCTYLLNGNPITVT